MEKIGLLSQPAKIGSLALANRVVMEPMVSNFATLDGQVSRQLISFLTERAKGGMGLIILEGAYPQTSGKGYMNQLGIDHDGLVPGLRDLVDAVHREGVPIFSQIMHVGRYAFFEAAGTQPIAPSALQPRIPREAPRAVTEGEINDLVSAYASAARRFRAAGFDGVEVQAASGYLLSSFLSPYSNRREDMYGGSLENRARFLLRVIGRVRQALGPDYPLSCRINGDELMGDEGNCDEDLLQVARWLVEAGCDAINLQMGWHEARIPTVTMEVPGNQFFQIGRKFTSLLDVPVILAHGIHSGQLAEEALTTGAAHLVGMARPFLADPLWLKKYLTGDGLIAPCIACCQGCFGRIFEHRPITCLVNPRVGREVEEVTEVRRSKKVVVIGGGPAGLTAAAFAARRGHHVEVWEREKRVGGQLVLAGASPEHDRFDLVVDYLIKSAEEAGARIVLQKKADAEELVACGAEAVVLAAGGSPVQPIGMEDRYLLATDVLAGTGKISGKRVAVIGGGLVGLLASEKLIDQSREVIVLEKKDRLAADATPFDRASLLRRLNKKGLTIFTGIDKFELAPGIIEFWQGQDKFSRQIDEVVFALGSKPRKALIEDISVWAEREGKQVLIVGDCFRPRSALEAVAEGYRAGVDL